LSFHVEPGKTLAIVGPTGAGKSTLAKLLSRFYEPQKGTITVDGTDVRKVTLNSLHRQMGVVLQEPFLFSGTIVENIKYGKLDASDDEVQRVAKIVGIHEFIRYLPQGYKTEVGERGVRLSVGQRQLVSFARALLGDPPILILDEATSSIDPYTELKIKKALAVLLKNRTSLVIAHRLSTVRNADNIIVIDEGRIVEEGNHKELMKKKGMYYHLYKKQFRDA
jgi:ABC-type multidrug transport system fused ATPase/permease subunit